MNSAMKFCHKHKYMMRYRAHNAKKTSRVKNKASRYVALMETEGHTYNHTQHVGARTRVDKRRYGW